MDETTLDVIAAGAHPDDVEIGCGGTLATLARQGHRVGIVDLTDGEPTPGCPGPDVRLAESRRAAETLGVLVRTTLDLPNRRLFDTFEARVALAREFRRHRPRLVLAPGGKTPLASPDHYQAMLIAEAAVFYARLSKWEEHFGGLAPCSSPMLLYYHFSLRSLSAEHAHGVVVDVGDVLERKIAAIACYASQFATRPELLERIRVFNRQQGMAAGLSAGEVVFSPAPLATRDLMGLVFGTPS